MANFKEKFNVPAGLVVTVPSDTCVVVEWHEDVEKGEPRRSGRMLIDLVLSEENIIEAYEFGINKVAEHINSTKK